MLASVAKTNRLARRRGGPAHRRLGGRLLGAVAEEALDDLDDAWIVATDETPIPYSPPLEDAFLPERGGDRGERG